MSEHRVCQFCLKPLVQKILSHGRPEKHAAFLRRKTCGMACAEAWKRRHLTDERERPCAVCGTVLVARKGEKPHNFRKRESCSRKCGAIMRLRTMNANRGSAPKLPPLPPKTLKRPPPVIWDPCHPDEVLIPVTEVPRAEMERLTGRHRGRPAYPFWGVQ